MIVKETKMNENHEKFIKRCYELAISAGKKGFDTFGAVLVSDGKIIAEAEKMLEKDILATDGNFQITHNDIFTTNIK